MRLCAALAALLLFLYSGGSASAVDTAAASAILIDAASGRVLYEENADEQRLIASITKIMTAYVALEHGDPGTVYTVGWEDMAEGSSMYLKPGEKITLEELLYGLMLASGNDAALAVARCVSGSVEDFVALMNETAKKLGMEHTSFANPNGLDHKEHYSTARDMAVLTAHAMEHEVFRRLVSTKSVTVGERVLTNHNKLLSRYEGCVGVKTGYTKAAGRTLVSAAERNGQRLIAVTLSDGNDWQDHTMLLDYGFSCYPRREIVKKGMVAGTARVKGSFVLTMPVTAAESFFYPLKEGEKPQISWKYYDQVTAPVVKNTILGEAVVSLNGEEIGRTALVAGADIAMTIDRKQAARPGAPLC